MFFKVTKLPGQRKKKIKDYLILKEHSYPIIPRTLKHWKCREKKDKNSNATPPNSLNQIWSLSIYA